MKEIRVEYITTSLGPLLHVSLLDRVTGDVETLGIKEVYYGSIKTIARTSDVPFPNIPFYDTITVMEKLGTNLLFFPYVTPEEDKKEPSSYTLESPYDFEKFSSEPPLSLNNLK